MSGGTLYFDWAATALPDETIIREAADTAISYYANPSSQHKAGRLAREKLEEARSCCAKALQVPSNTLFFTSGGTESDQIVLLSFLQRPKTGNILISNIEHPAVREQAHMLAYCGWKIREIPVDDSGILTPQSVVSAIDSDTAAIFIMAVNNETGAINWDDMNKRQLCQILTVAEVKKAYRDAKALNEKALKEFKEWEHKYSAYFHAIPGVGVSPILFNYR